MPIPGNVLDLIKYCVTALGNKRTGQKMDLVYKAFDVSLSEKEAQNKGEKLENIIKSKILAIPCPECNGKKNGDKPCWACKGLGAMTEQDEKEYWLKP